jgi:putative transposase
VASVLVSLLHSLRFLVRSRAALHLEIIALRHQLGVVNRSAVDAFASRRPTDILGVALGGMARLAPGPSPRQAGDRHRLAPAGLSSVLDLEESRAHRAPGRATRRSCPDTRVVHRESPLGCASDSRELQKLGISVSQSTVAKYMRRHPHPPSQTWRTFLTDHVSHIMAADLFVLPTVTFRLLFVLVVLAHERRRLVHVAVTEHPTAAWTAQQLRNAFPDDEAPGYLVHDRDAVFADVASTIAGMNIQAVRTAPRSPWQNAYVERVIGSIRRECLDHVIVASTAGLQRVLTEYIAYYMRSRTHLALEKDAPISRPVRPPSAGRVVATPLVGGLHHHYDRAAA